jgi:S-adenosylmethionine decarboxylase
VLEVTILNAKEKIIILTTYTPVPTLNPTRPEPQKAEDVLQKEIIPGLHIIANFQSGVTERLMSHKTFKSFVELLMEEFNLTSVGEVYHDFPNGGFTGVVCLTESHLSIHTWPEQNYLTFDVFLSNYLRDNRVTTQAIYQAIQEFFQAKILFEQIISR